MYNLLYTEKVFKQLDKIPDVDVRRITQAIEALALNPMPFGYKKISGKDNFYRIRQGDYRIVYSIDSKQEQIVIIFVKHRKEAYR